MGIEPSDFAGDQREICGDGYHFATDDSKLRASRSMAFFSVSWVLEPGVSAASGAN